MNPAFAHIDCWIFDLDNTLYPATGPVWDNVGKRMTAYVSRITGLEWRAAEELQERYLHEHGATLAGMIAHHDIDAHDFLRDVHDIDFSVVDPDPELAGLMARLPGKRIVYTNGAHSYARNVLARLGIADAIHDVFALEDAGLFPKPQVESYRRLIARFAIDPTRALMVEDTPRNLQPAHALGMKTALIHPEPGSDFPDHIHHAADEVKAFLRAVLNP